LSAHNSFIKANKNNAMLNPDLQIETITKYLMIFCLLLTCFTFSAQASTDSTTIGITVFVENSCQLSIGGKVSGPTNSCQLSEPEFAKKLAQLPATHREQTVTQRDGSLSIRVSMTAP